MREEGQQRLPVLHDLDAGVVRMDFEVELGKQDIVAWQGKALTEWRAYANRRTREFMQAATEIYMYWNWERAGMMTPDEFDAFGALASYTKTPPSNLSE